MPKIGPFSVAPVVKRTTVTALFVGTALLGTTAVGNAQGTPGATTTAATANRGHDAMADTRLPDAAQRDDKATVRALVRQKANANAVQPDGTTALHWAVRQNDAELVDQLLAAGANVNAQTRYGTNAIYFAAVNGHAAILEKLLKAGADANFTNADGEAVLMTASRTGKPDAVKVLLDHGAKVNTAEAVRGQTAVMWAAAENHPDVVRLLVERGADLNAHTKETPAPDPAVIWTPGRAAGDGITRLRARPQPGGGFTALHFAARDGNLEMTKFLVELGAKVNERTASGMTPMLASVINNHFKVAQYLLDHNTDPNLADSYQRTALFAALEMRNIDNTREHWVMHEDEADAPKPLDFIKALLAHEADVNTRTMRTPIRGYQQGDGSWVNFDGQTPFIKAALTGDITVMKLLLENGADPKIKTFEGSSALMAAAGVNWVANQTFNHSKEEFLEAVQLCMELSLDVNEANSMGFTPMHGAANRGSNEIIQLLARHGAKLDPKDKVGRTPMTFAEGVFLALYPPVKKDSTIALLKELMAKQSSGDKVAAK
jgi:ankyrin repeat protein